MNSVRENLIQAGLARFDIKTWIYETNRPDFTGLGADVIEYNPDGLLIIGFEESAAALTALLRAGLTSRPI
jgi:hypothetical protein